MDNPIQPGNGEGQPTQPPSSPPTPLEIHPQFLQGLQLDPRMLPWRAHMTIGKAAGDKQLTDEAFDLGGPDPGPQPPAGGTDRRRASTSNEGQNLDRAAAWLRPNGRTSAPT